MRKKLKNKKIILLIVILVLAIAVGSFLYYKSQRDDSTSDFINYNPPTKSEREAANSQKENNIEREKVDNAPVSQTAEVMIVDASQYNQTIEVRAYISNIYEDGGTCFVTFTRGGQTVSRQSKGFKDATTTQCEPFNIPRSEFTATGDWKVTVTYSSSAAKGESNPQTISIN